MKGCNQVKQKDRKKLLNHLSAGLGNILGERIEQVLIYGSYARGEAEDDSDLDILVVLRGDFDYADMIRQTSELVARLSLENDVVISRAFISKERLENERSPFILNIQREGIPV
jgi:uncharacterized protein